MNSPLHSYSKLLIAILISLCMVPAASYAATTLIPRSSTWKYLDDGSNQGSAWRNTAFPDGTWVAGSAQLGYGDSDESTVVSYGPDAGNKHITTYFRHSFNVTDPSTYSTAWLGLLRDDGAIVYLNGTEVFRSNMPAGAINYQTAASTASAGADESLFHTQSINSQLLLTGSNTIAVEIHQINGTSSDISFDLELFASDEVALTRGPYLQLGTSNAMTVRWRTASTTESVVRYGLSTTALDNTVLDGTAKTEHIVSLTGLQADTKYYYSIGTQTQLLSGGDADTFFVTSPAIGTHKQTRIWVLGDSGTANADAAAVRNGYYTFTGARHTDLWLMLGDNAYNIGLDTEFQAAVFDMYPAMLRKSVLWPTFGNHDAGSAISSSQTGPYYDIFTLPKAAEAGGLATGTEAYYSFDYGSAHFVCLDSQGTDRSPTGTMLTWLQNDLAATSQEWIIAYFHHPPYTKGSHDSDSVADSGGRMFDMRQNALPILEAAGVCLVLTGHSHSYERSFLLNGHYGVSSTLTPAMKLNAGDGKVTGDGAYSKTAFANGSNDGSVYAVAGSSGKISGGSLNHPAMHISLNSLGSMVLDLDRNQLDAKFLNDAGAVLDEFTIVKDSAVSPLVSSIARIDVSPTNATTVRYRVQFTQAVTGVDISDFNLTLTGGAAGSIASVSGSGSEYVLTVNVSNSAGTAQLELADNDSIRNTLDARLGGTGFGNGNYTGETYTLPVAISTFSVE